MGRNIAVDRFPECGAVGGGVLLARRLLAGLDRVHALLEKLSAFLGDLAHRGEAYLSACSKPHIAGSAIAGETKYPRLRATVGNPQVKAAAIAVEALVLEIPDPDGR